MLYTDCPWYRSRAFRGWYKAATGFAISALTGVMTWEAAGVSAAVALIAASYDIFFGPEGESA